jgi:hypothetical protein
MCRRRPAAGAAESLESKQHHRPLGWETLEDPEQLDEARVRFAEKGRSRTFDP